MKHEKTCKDCGIKKPLSDFYKHAQMRDGHLNNCKQCKKSMSTIHRDNNLDRIREYDRNRSKLPHKAKARKEYHARWKKENPEKYKAHNAVNSAVRDGRIIKPDTCSNCGDGGIIHGHHHDYSKPLDVTWLCVKCHGRATSSEYRKHQATKVKS